MWGGAPNGKPLLVRDTLTCDNDTRELPTGGAPWLCGAERHCGVTAQVEWRPSPTWVSPSLEGSP